MEFFKNQYVIIVGSSIAVYLFILLGIRIFGKKELSQLSVIDLVFILLISNAVQNAMVANNGTLLGGLVAAATLFVMNYLLKQLVYFFPGLSRVVQGKTILLVYKGKANHDNLQKARITIAELEESIREHGVTGGIADVDLAVLETDGNISVLSDDFRRKSSRKRKLRKGLLKDQ
jgi:uncharacterized membrane protein YcaP (DUF421 family)